jgi:hypothetical protein
MPCAVCTMHVETRSVDFLVEPQNQDPRFSLVWPQNLCDGFPGLGLKTGSTGLVIWVSKSPRRFLFLASKPSRLRFVGYAIKPTEGGRCGTHVEI